MADIDPDKLAHSAFILTLIATIASVVVVSLLIL